MILQIGGVPQDPCGENRLGPHGFHRPLRFFVPGLLEIFAFGSGPRLAPGFWLARFAPRGPVGLCPSPLTTAWLDSSIRLPGRLFSDPRRLPASPAPANFVLRTGSMVLGRARGWNTMGHPS